MNKNESDVKCRALGCSRRDGHLGWHSRVIAERTLLVEWTDEGLVRETVLERDEES